MRLVQRPGYRVVVGGPVPPQAAAITLGNTVIVRERAEGDDDLMAHELVHVRQFRQLGAVGFLGRYVGSYLLWRFRGYRHMAAYRRIPLEVEASWLSRLHDLDELEREVDDAETVADPTPVRTAPPAHRGPDRMWRSRASRAVAPPVLTSR